MQDRAAVLGRPAVDRSQLTAPAARSGILKDEADADTFLIDGYPIQDIRLLMDSANIDLTLKDGKIYNNDL